MTDTRQDAATGVLIVLVVFAHLLELVNGEWDDGLVRLTLTVVHSFLFPALAFLMGLAIPARQFLERLVTVGLALIAFQCLGFLGALWQDVASTWSWMTPYGALWFLLTLLGWLLTVPLVDRFPRTLSVLSFAVGITAGLLPYVSLELPILRFLIFWPFFVLGRSMGPWLLRTVTGLPLWTSAGLCAVAFVPPLTLFVAEIGRGWLLANDTFDELGVSGARGVLIRFCLNLIALLAITALLAIVPAAPGTFSRIGEKWLTVFLLHCFAGAVVAPALAEFFARGYDHPVQIGAVALSACAALGLAQLLSLRVVNAVVAEPVQRLATAFFSRVSEAESPAQRDDSRLPQGERTSARS